MAIESPDSELDICNMALGKCGVKQITDALLTANTEPRAIQCNLHYAQTRDALLRSHWWRFAGARADIRLVTNGNFANWTSDNPDDWTVTGEVAGTDEVSEVGSGEGYGGTGLRKCNIYSTTDGEGIYITQTITTVVGIEYKFSININKITEGEVGVNGLPTGDETYDSIGIKTITFTADDTSIDLVIAGGTALATDVTFDNISVYVVPIFEWTYGYRLPTDFLAMRSVYGGGVLLNTPYSYALEGKFLYSSENEMEIRYIKQVTAVTDFDPLFLEVFVLQLALKMIFPIAGVGSAGRAMAADIKEELYGRGGLMAKVRALDRQESEKIGRADKRLWNNSRSANFGRMDHKLGSN